MMRSTVRHAVLILLSVLTLSVLLEVVAEPQLAGTSAPVASPLPPLPTPMSSAASSLDGVVDNYPIVVKSFPDAQSTHAAAEEAAMNPLDSTQALQTLHDIWAGLTSSDGSGHLGLRDFLLNVADVGLSGIDASVFSNWVTQDFPSLVRDPANADRLSNAAVALFALSLGQDQGAATYTDNLTTPGQLARNAMWLLSATQQQFSAAAAPAADHLRATTLNLAWQLASATGGPPDIETDQQGSNPVDINPVDIVSNWVDGHPADRGARYLLAGMLASALTAGKAPLPTPDDALRSALAIVQPLSQDAPAAALADSAAGDAYFAAALAQSGTAPYHARTLARSALDEYDAALQLNTDAGLYAGRARVLKFLGDAQLAHESAMVALTRSGGSTEALMLVATIDEASGDFAGMRDAARAAEARLFTGWRPTLSTVRFLVLPSPPITSIAGDRVLSIDEGAYRWPAAYSNGSLIDHITVWTRWFGAKGAAGAFITTLVPRTRDPAFETERDSRLLQDEAAALAMQASVLLSDPSGADHDYQRWRSAMNDAHIGGDATQPALPQGPQYLYQPNRDADLSTVDMAAHVAGQPSSATWGPPVLLLDTILRRAGRFQQDSTVWRHVVATTSDATSKLSAGERLAEAEYLAGNYSDAQTALMPFHNQETSDPQNADASYFGDLVPTAIRLGEYAQALDLMKLWLAGAPADAGLIDEQRGEIDLLEGNANAAVNDFTQAVKQDSPVSGELILNVNENGDATISVNADPQVAYGLAESNLSISILRSVQKSQDVAPDCVASRAACTAADAGLQAALAVDPDNAAVLMNRGWTKRLLGDAQGEQVLLEQAVRSDSTLFPALNDLGVLRAEAGHTDAARQLFEQALQADHGYDLAVWNLGVLEMRSPAGIPRGQALLARAGEINPALRSQGLQYRTDERIYLINFQRGAAAPFSATYSLGIALLGSFGLLSLLMVAAAEISKDRGRAIAANFLGQGEKVWVALWNRFVPPAVQAAALSGWGTVLSLLVIAVVVTLWSNSMDGVSLALVAVLAAVFGILIHEAGHIVVGRVLQREVRASGSPGGLVLALLMIPLRAVGGPYVGHEIVPSPDAAVPAGDDAARRQSRQRDLIVYVAGPAANVVAAAVLAVLLFIHPLPFLRVMLLVQIGVITFSLLPLRSMEGKVLHEEHPRLLGVALLALGILGVLFGEGVL